MNKSEEELKAIQNTLRVSKDMSVKNREKLVERRNILLELLNRDKLLRDVYYE